MAAFNAFSFLFYYLQNVLLESRIKHVTLQKSRIMRTGLRAYIYKVEIGFWIYAFLFTCVDF